MPSFATPDIGELTCAVSTVANAARVTVSGEVDLATALLLADALRCAEGRPGGMIVDLSGVEFLDCRGVELLLGTARRVRARGGRFRLDGVSQVVARLLCVTDNGIDIDIDGNIEAPPHRRTRRIPILRHRPSSFPQ